MKRLKAFFYVIYKSITSLDYYNELLKTKFLFTFKYYLGLCFLLAISGTIAISATTLPEVKTRIKDFVASAKNLYPPELVITGNQTEWSINQPEPYFIMAPDFEGQPHPKNALTFDHNGTVDDLQKYDTFALINSKNLIARSQEGFSVYPLENLPSGEFNREKYDLLWDKLNNIFGFLPYLVLVLSFVFAFFYYLVIKGLFLFLISVPVWLVAKQSNLKPTFIQTNTIVFHAATLPLIIDVVINSFNINIPIGFWFLFLVLFLSFALIFSIDKGKEQ